MQESSIPYSLINKLKQFTSIDERGGYLIAHYDIDTRDIKILTMADQATLKSIYYDLGNYLNMVGVEDSEAEEV